MSVLIWLCYIFIFVTFIVKQGVTKAESET